MGVIATLSVTLISALETVTTATAATTAATATNAATRTSSRGAGALRAVAACLIDEFGLRITNFGFVEGAI